MPTEITTRGGLTIRNDPFGGGLTGSFLLHGAIAALFIGSAWYFHTGQNWGSTTPSTSTIQATMVNSLPFPPKVLTDQENVLATDNPSPAPAPPAPKTVAVPEPNAIPIPVKPTKPAEKTTPPPPLHPQPAAPELNKATAGEAPASLPVTSVPTQAGTSSIQTQDAAFGIRFAYYVQQITQKVAQQWYTGMLDPQAYGHRACITFQVERDGSLTHIQIAQRSGDSTLDQTALSAVQHIDTFGPLPDAYSGTHINVTYYFDPPPRH
ncbi:MAG: cell envelope integrity protein TolA [Acidobacteriaceae bacterium]|jgi:protein TonB